MCLNSEQVKALRAPLPLVGGHSVKVKAESKEDASKQWALWLVYTEEAPISERLDEVDPNWTFEITDKVVNGNAAAIYARLTVCGISRDCVGEGSSNNPGDAQKSAATDALKRGARLFGVGRYLQDAPTFYTDWVPKKGRKRQPGYIYLNPAIPVPSAHLACTDSIFLQPYRKIRNLVCRPITANIASRDIALRKRRLLVRFPSPAAHAWLR